MKFTKMQGAGNDYIYINCLKEQVEDPAALAVRVSDRHFGIGADGLVLICPSAVADFKMRIFNADGSEAKMCGNATRCVAKYVHDNGLTAKNPVTLETLSGVKTIQVAFTDGKVTSARVDMGAPILSPARIPVDLPGETVVAQPLRLPDGACLTVTCVSMGNPHCVAFVEDTANFPLEQTGPRVERHPCFPDRVNAEFVRLLDPLHIAMRVWERGSGETLACGTGACASVAACILNGYCAKDTDVTVTLRGGELLIRWDSVRDTIYMTGPAEVVCTGEIF
ncbi:MAG: diaminopimelate epimerase [Oscillospiraceae bacterium]|jgi:diaminopimelate epimerase|nr:diaminopimelate epimerase [Oscillospiraceae bacterium]